PIPESTTEIIYAQWVNNQNVAYFAQDSVKGNGIYLANIDGSAVEKIYSVEETGGFDMSTDMTSLIVSELRRNDQGNWINMLVLVDLSKGNKRDLVHGVTPDFVANDQKIVFRNGVGISLLNLNGNNIELSVKVHWFQFYHISMDRTSFITISEETIIWVNILEGATLNLGKASDFKAFRAPHWDDEVTTRLRTPFLSADGKKAYVFVYRSYVDDGCPD